MLSDDVVVSRDDAARDAAVSWSTAMTAEFVSRSSSSALMVMLKPLNDGRWAILVANLGAGAPAFAISLDSLAPAGVPVPATVTNVFTSEAVTDVEVIEGEVPPRDAAMYIVDIA